MALTKVTGQVIKSDTNVTVGVITATKFVGPIETTGDVSAVDGTFTGSVSIAGTLTYADVTNVDSLGIVTARHGFRATAGGINVTAGISTFGGNIDANGTLDVAGDVSIADKIVHTGDTNTALRFPTADTITAETGGSERLRIKSDGKVGIGTVNPTSLLTVGARPKTTTAAATVLISPASGNASDASPGTSTGVSSAFSVSSDIVCSPDNYLYEKNYINYNPYYTI